MSNQVSTLFKDPTIEYPIYNMQLHFADYITKCKSIIASVRTDLRHDNIDTILETNTPFELIPNADKKTGVILIHGLLDSPFQLKEIGHLLQSRGFWVRSILLPGHGTVPGALLNVDYNDWLQAVRYSISSFKNDGVEKILLVGNSTGASLALHQAAENNSIISGVVLLSPAIQILSKFAPYSKYFKALSHVWKRAAWFHIDPEETLDYAKYGSLPYNAIYQVYLLSKELKHSPKCPLFFILSEDDAIISPQATMDYHHNNPNSSLLLYTNHPSNLSPDKRIEIRPSAYPDQHIINFSHISLPFTPTNHHYGAQGDYPYASHIYENENTVYGEFLRNNLFYNRCARKLHFTHTKMARLTFNPDFDYMSQRIAEFADSCASMLEFTQQNA
jgi:esterase/lipase